MRIISYIFIILLTPFLILTNYRILVFSQSFYNREFTSLGVYNLLDKNTVDNQSKILINYLCCSEKIDQNFFTERERSHLKDVKNLIKISQIYIAFLSAAILTCAVVLFIKSPKLLKSALFWGSLASVATVIMLALLSLVNFNFAFIKFHQILFNNDLWLLPESSNLIKLFQQKFFADFANLIAYLTAAEASIILIISKIWDMKFNKLPR